MRFFGEHEITPKTFTLASSSLFWGYSAAAAGRFAEHEHPKQLSLAPKCLFWSYSAAAAGKFAEYEIAPKTATLAVLGK